MTKNRLVLQGARGKGECEVTAGGHGISFGINENVLKSGCGSKYSILTIPKPLNYTRSKS